jgi:hypothetical protein
MKKLIKLKQATGKKLGGVLNWGDKILLVFGDSFSFIYSTHYEDGYSEIKEGTFFDHRDWPIDRLIDLEIMTGEEIDSENQRLSEELQRKIDRAERQEYERLRNKFSKKEN